MNYYLAQVNIARMRARPDEAAMAGLIARLDEMNELADRSAGFIWRLPGTAATPDALRAFAEYFQPFDPDYLFYNLSVWESIEHLRAYVYQSPHSQMLRGKPEWITAMDRPHLAMWWIPTDERPTIAESARRLHALDQKGATPFAFTFKTAFPPPSASDCGARHPA